MPDSSRTGAKGQRGHRPLSPLVLAGVAVLVGLALGRFAFFSPDAAVSAASQPAPPLTTSGAQEERVAALEEAVAADAGDLASWQALGAAYVQRAAEVGDPVFYGLAEQAFDRADEIRPGAQATLLGRGSLALSLHDFTEARELGARAMAAAPDSAEPVGVVVDAEVELGRYDDAAEHVQRMLDLRPGTAALARASYLRQLHGDVSGAITAMRQAATAAQSAPFEGAVVTALVGDLQWSRGDLDAAHAAYDEADELVPGLIAAEVGRARVEAAHGDVDSAITRLGAVVDRYPRPDAVILLGELQTLVGDQAQADATAGVVRAITRLQEDAGQSVDLELAVFEADQGDPGVAVELARRAHDDRPDNVHAQGALAWALARDGDAEAAVEHIEGALRLETADPVVRYHAAVIFDAVGDTDRAASELAAALSANPHFSFLHHDDAIGMAERLEVEVPAGQAG